MKIDLSNEESFKNFVFTMSLRAINFVDKTKNVKILDKNQTENLIKEMEELISDWRKGFKTLDDFKFNTMKDLLPYAHKYAENGWFFYYVYDLRKMKNISNNYNSDSDKFLIDFYSKNNYETIKNITELFNFTAQYNKSFEYFVKALGCLYSGNYYSFTCSIFPLIENLLVSTEYYSTSKGQSYFKSNINEKLNKYGLNFIVLIWKDMNNFLEKIFQSYKRCKTQPNIFVNRNKIEHGLFDREITQKDCIQLVLFYLSLLENIQILGLLHMIDEIQKLKKELINNDSNN